MSRFLQYMDEKSCDGTGKMDGSGKKKRKQKGKMDEGNLNEGSGAIVHTNLKIEDQLRKAGFDIPKYPKTGEVTLNGEKVGHMDNFTGLVIYTKDALSVIKKAIPKLGIWNEKDAK